jgi:hypothetical protein
MEIREFVADLASSIKRLSRPLPQEFIGYGDDKAANEQKFLKVMNWSDQHLRPSRIRDELTVKKGQTLVDHLDHGVVEAGGRSGMLPAPSWDDSRHSTEDKKASLEKKQDWLAAVASAFARSVDAVITRAEPVLDHLSWRRVPRPALLTSLSRKLLDQSRVAIVGMSGTGKSFLARQFYDRFNGRGKLWLDAPKPQRGQLLLGQTLDLGIKTFNFLAEHVRSNIGQNSADRAHFERRLKDIATFLARPGQAQTPETLAHEMDASIVDKRSELWGKALAPYVARMASLDGVVCALCALLPLLDTRNSSVSASLLIVLDDVWLPIHLKGLFDALAPLAGQAAPQTKFPIQLLITSQDRLSVFAGGRTRTDQELRRSIIEFDRDEADQEEFALSVLAAWSAPETREMTFSEGLDLITTQRDAIAASSVLTSIRHVLGKTGWHPLTAASLGAWWREAADDGIWAGLADLFDGEQPIDLDFDDASDLLAREAGINDRHRRVVQALLLVTTTALSPAERQRFFDLAIQRRGSGPVDVTLFEYFWRRHPREGSTLAPNDVGNLGLITRKFASLMLVQSTATGFVLHDMLRLAIASALKDDPERLSARHRALVDSAGLLDQNDKLLLDQDRDFVWEEGHPDVVMSERCRLLLRLRPPFGKASDSPTVKTRSKISRYFLDELPHHVRAIDRAQGSRQLERALLTNLAYLQAQLDWIDDGANEEG